MSFTSTFSNSQHNFVATYCICDGSMPQWINNLWAVYTNKYSHLYSRVKSMCLTSWTVDLDHIQWEHRDATGQNPKAKGNEGLQLTFRGENLGTKPKVYNNDTVEMCRSNWERSFGSVTERGSVAIREDSGGGKASCWHGHYQWCQHGSDRCNKLIPTFSHMGFNKTMHQNTGLENWLW